MSDFRDKLYEKTVANIEAHTEEETVGYVLEADEYNNRCLVRYVNYVGKLAVDYVDVKLSGCGQLEWFPGAGEPVVLAMRESEIFITGRYIDDFNRLRTGMKTEWDVYPESVDCTYGGFLY